MAEIERRRLDLKKAALTGRPFIVLVVSEIRRSASHHRAGSWYCFILSVSMLHCLIH
jgi:hypothetical protein